jgi:hypothetical protein
VKPLAIWLVVFAAVFGGFAVVASSQQETSQVFVFVDSSNPMDGVWRDVPAALDGIDGADRSEFALAQGQSRGAELVHSFRPELDLGAVMPFAPCSFDEIDGFTEAADADERILVTTAGSCDTSALVDWTIVLLEE